MAIAEKTTFRYVGQSIPRLDGDEKVRGLTQYVDDIRVPGAWHGCVVRSAVSHGKLKSVSFDPAFDWNRVCVVTPKDIPGENLVDMMGRDMPFIAHDLIQYLGEPVVLVAAPTKRLAGVAASYVRVDIEEHPPILTLDELIERHKSRCSTLHTLHAQTIVKGDIERGLAASDHIVEGEYRAGHQEHLYLEPQGMVAVPEPDGGIFIQGSLQCPYYINPELCSTLNIPREKLRVKQAAVGGAFGGKEEFPTLIAGYCALLAMKCGKPVKIVYDRHQDILFTTKRHPVWVRYRTGVKKDGTLTAMEVDFVLDGGAYTTISPVVLFRGILHTTLGYRCPDIFIDGHVYRTNTFPNGAFRGFGAPQAVWGLESHMDKVAAACGLAPHEFRLKNALRTGDTTATGQVIAEDMGTPAVLESALKRADFAKKLARCSRGSAPLTAGGRLDGERMYGIGLSFFGHGSGFTGDGERRLNTKAALDLEYDEHLRPVVNVRISSTEMGQGTVTIMPQIAADGLSAPIDFVRCPLPDTKFVPDSGPTVASRTTMVVGSTVYSAARKMKDALRAFATDQFGDPVPYDNDFAKVAAAYLKAKGPLRVMDQFHLPDTITWNQKTFEGDSYPSYSWGCNIAEVEIDPLTLEIHVRRITAFYDIGRLINPVLAKGQIEGGLTQALGYSVMEKMEIKKGVYDANRMQTYVVPTMPDIPEFDIHFLEYPYLHAVPGAKGVGEIPMDGLAPAIANAVEAATGIRITDLPITPEKLLTAKMRRSRKA
ncbi:MAG: xanthine dehydrogenase family protein molybdopterin-binding subunit [bacterium]